jgi:hypothetical protein
MTGQEKDDCIIEVTTLSGLTVCNYSVFYDWTKLEIQTNLLFSLRGEKNNQTP